MASRLVLAALAGCQHAALSDRQARRHATPDSGLNNLGFRCVRDL
jgi:hypothetical protein